MGKATGKAMAAFLALFILLGLCGVTPADAKMLVVAPHPDDDVISSAGVTYNAVKNGEPVRVLIMTNGDAGIYPNGTQAGLLRQGEAVTAQGILGVKEDDVIFLGYPDAYMQALYDSYPNASQKLTTSWGQSVTYGNRGLGRKDYHYYRFGTHANYNGYNVIADLADLLSSYRPDHIFVTSEFDGHSDHVATYRFVKAAVLKVHGDDPTYMPTLHKTIIWWGEGDTWPNLLDVTRDFAEIPDLTPRTGLVWGDRESLEVPLPLQASSLSSNPKYQAQAAHVSQANLAPLGFLTRFVHKDEIFWVENLTGVSEAPSSNAGQDQIVGEGAFVRLDGSASVSRNGGALSFQWRQTDGKSVALSSPASATPSFNAPTGLTATETLTFQLVVSEGGASSVPDQVKVTVRPGGTPSFAFAVTMAGTGTGTVRSTPAGIDCGGICNANFLSGTTVTLTATPDAGSTFAAWSGAACSGSGPCTVSVADAVTVTANFSEGGLVGAYGFDEGNGTSTADASGNGLNATISAGTWTSAGKNGTTIAFNGSSTMVSIADSDLLDLSKGLTLEAWVSPAAPPTGWKTIIMKEGQGFYVYGLYLSPSGHPAIYLVINGQEEGFEVSTPVPVNTWSHIAATFDGSTVSLYQNGTLIASQPLDATIPASNGSLRIGGNTIWGGEQFNGKIDDVRIYNRGLTAAEVTRDMNSAVGGQPVPATVADLTVTPATVVGGAAASAVVTLTSAAPAGGAIVTLLSESPSVAVPPTVTVPAGSVTVTFPVSTSAVASTTTAAFSASYAGTSRTATIILIPPVPSYLVSVAISGTGGGSVTSTPAGIDCGSACSASYPSGTALTLRAIPGAGSAFAGWSGACSGTGSCTVTVGSPLSVTANFTSGGQLVAAYAFDEGTGNIAHDASGNGQDGTITAGNWSTSGKHGAALVLNGSSTWVTVPDSNLLDLSTALTVEAWVYPTAIPKSWKTVIMKEAGSFYVYGLYFSPSSHPAVYLVINGLEQGFEATSVTLPINAWSHLAVTFDGAELRLYVNGTPVETKPIPGASIPASSGPLRIGGNSLWKNEFFKGRIDDLRIYNRPLSVTEIQADMATGVK